MTDYDGWWSVPDHLVTKTTAAALDMPRSTKGVAVAGRVTDRHAPGGRATFDLFDVTQCPPTSATARQLAAARATSAGGRGHRCGDCGARTERPVHAVGAGAGLCPACRHIVLLRAKQADLAAERELIAADVAAVLDGPSAVAVQVDEHMPPPADSGRARPATAARVRVAGLDGRRLADITVRLVGPKARWVPENAVDPETGRAQLEKALDGQRLVVWSAPELDQLSALIGTDLGTQATLAWSAPYLTDTYDRGPERAGQYRDWLISERRDSPAVLLGPAAARWRGVLNPVTRDLVDPLPPGTPDRTALLMATMASRALGASARRPSRRPDHGPSCREGEELMAAAESSPEPYHDDPDAPYFEHLYGVLKGQRPDMTRDEALEILREIDPDDELRISLPQSVDIADLDEGPVTFS